MKKRNKWVGAAIIAGAICFGFTIPAILMCPHLQPDLTDLLTPATVTAEPAPFDTTTATWKERMAHRWQSAKQTSSEWAIDAAAKTSDWAGRKTDQVNDWLEDDAPWAAEQTWLSKKLVSLRRYCTR